MKPWNDVLIWYSERRYEKRITVAVDLPMPYLSLLHSLGKEAYS